MDNSFQALLSVGQPTSEVMWLFTSKNLDSRFRLRDVTFARFKKKISKDFLLFSGFVSKTILLSLIYPHF